VPQVELFGIGIAVRGMRRSASAPPPSALARARIVGGHALRLAGEQRSRFAETGLHLVDDQQHAVAAAQSRAAARYPGGATRMPDSPWMISSMKRRRTRARRERRCSAGRSPTARARTRHGDRNRVERIPCGRDMPASVRPWKLLRVDRMPRRSVRHRASLMATRPIQRRCW